MAPIAFAAFDFFFFFLVFFEAADTGLEVPAPGVPALGSLCSSSEPDEGSFVVVVDIAGLSSLSVNEHTYKQNELSPLNTSTKVLCLRAAPCQRYREASKTLSLCLISR
jgi:hypothetical protein